MYFAYDVKSVKSFIFDSLEFKAVAGASFLLRDFDTKVRDELKGMIDFVYAAGGTGFGRVSNDAKKDEIERKFKNVKEKILYDHPVVYRFIDDQELEELKIEDSDKSEFSKNLMKIFYLLGIEKTKFSKDEIKEIRMNEETEKCESCGKRKVEKTITNVLEGSIKELKVCELCYRKIKRANKEKSKFSELTFDLHSVAKIQSEDSQDESGYIGVFYADGNSLGDIYENFEDEESYKKFSKELLKFVRDEIKNEIKEKLEIEELTAPIVGGDDIMFILPPNKLFDALDVFDQIVTEKDFMLKNRKLTFSIGATILKATVPIGFIFEIVEKILKNAKKKRAEDGNLFENYIAFRYISKFDLNPKIEYAMKPFKLIAGEGMSYSEFKKIRNWSSDLKDVKRKIFMLKDALLRSDTKEEAKISSLYFLVRSLDRKDKLDIAEKFYEEVINEGKLGNFLEVFSAVLDWGDKS